MHRDGEIDSRSPTPDYLPLPATPGDLLMRVAMLSRVSDVTQGTADRHSLPFQRSEMERSASLNGWDVVRVYEIPGESAYKDFLAERPQFAEAVTAARSRAFEMLMIYDVSRFARNEAVGHEVLRDLRLAGVGLWVTASGYDATTPEGALRFSVELMIAADHSRQQSAKIRRAYERRHELGLHTGNVPFGYAMVEGHPELPARVVPAEAQLVRWVFAQRARGAEMTELAAEFGRRGFAVRSVSSVASLIETRFYCGFVVHKGHEAKGSHEAILTEAEWAAAQSVVRANTQQAREERPLLTGIASCVDCGGPVWTRYGGGDAYYYDAAWKRAKVCSAPRRGWRSRLADASIERLITEMAAPSTWFEEAAAMSRSNGEQESREERRARAEGKRERATRAYVAGVLSEARWREACASVAVELAALETSEAVPARSMARVASMGEAWGLATNRERGELVRILFEGVQLDMREQLVVSVHPRADVADLVGLRAEWVKFGCVAPPAGLERNPQPLSAYRWYDLAELVA